jgi:hypothetical protein
MINDLPELEEIEPRMRRPEPREREGYHEGQRHTGDYNGFTNQPGMPEEKLQKFLRAPMRISPQAGMTNQIRDLPSRPPPPHTREALDESIGGYGHGNGAHATMNYEARPRQEYSGPPPHGPNGLPNGPNGLPQGLAQGLAQEEQIIQENFVREAGNTSPPLNCIDVANHIQSCPICSKFYNNDKTLYILAIIILSIVCLLLLKKVLNI